MYDDGEYASTRLVDTLVRHKGKSVLVCRVMEDMTALVRCLEDGEDLKVELDDLDLKSPPLGYVNYGGRAYYLARKPMRRDWRQGVRTNSVRALVGGPHRLSMEMIAKCVEGVFPSTKEALARLGEVPKVAVSREFCLSKNQAGSIVINYKWYGRVGVLRGGKAVFSKKFNYLPADLGGVL